MNYSVAIEASYVFQDLRLVHFWGLCFLDFPFSIHESKFVSKGACFSLGSIAAGRIRSSMSLARTALLLIYYSLVSFIFDLFSVLIL